MGLASVSIIPPVVVNVLVRFLANLDRLARGRSLRSVGTQCFHLDCEGPRQLGRDRSGLRVVRVFDRPRRGFHGQ